MLEVPVFTWVENVRYCWWQLLAAFVAVASTAGVGFADGDQTDEIATSARFPIANGNMVICQKTQSEATSSVLIHFHGAAEIVERAYAASNYDGVLVVVNFPGLSSAYANPIAEDPHLFDAILHQAREETDNSSGEDAASEWDEISLSSFSAGYGAVREILKSNSNIERIDVLIAADSIYAGIEQDAPIREVNAEHMQDFLRFARRATRDKKRFILSHSAQPTPYASTTETADYLLRSLDLDRDASQSHQRDGMQQETRASRGGLLMLGFAGTTGRDHMRHLHNIDLLWDQCFPEDRNSAGDDPG